MKQEPHKENLFRSVVESDSDRIYRVCCCYIRDKDERKDVFQEVLIHIWNSLGTFRNESQISTWIYRITVNTCLGFLRTEKRRAKVFEKAATDGGPEIPDPSWTPDTGETEREIQDLYGCINELPAFEKTIISLYLEDVGTKQMAEILGISEVNVRVKLHRIRKELKARMEVAHHGSR